MSTHTTTRSPMRVSVTLAPTADTTPANSWPGMMGGVTVGMRPSAMWISVMQRPHAFTSMVTSPGGGGANSSIANDQGLVIGLEDGSLHGSLSFQAREAEPTAQGALEKQEEQEDGDRGEHGDGHCSVGRIAVILAEPHESKRIGSVAGCGTRRRAATGTDPSCRGRRGGRAQPGRAGTGGRHDPSRGSAARSAPSIRAASRYSVGILRMNCRMRNTPKASMRSGPAIPWRLLTQPSLWMTRKVGTSVTSSGSMSVLRIKSRRSSAPGKRYLASP